MDLNFSKVSMTKQEIEYVKALNLSPKMEALIKHPTYTDFGEFNTIGQILKKDGIL